MKQRPIKQMWAGLVSAGALSLMACGVVQSGPTTPPPPGGVPQAFFLPTDAPENTAGSTVKTDSQGNLHAVYRVYARGDAFYSLCAKTCTSAAQARPVRFKTEGAVQNVMLALTRAGQPRVLINTSQRVYYASCDTNCVSSASWNTSVILGREAFGDQGLDISGEAFALDPQDRPRFVMSSYPQLIGSMQSRFDTYYVQCDGACQQAGSWTRALLYRDEAWREVQLQYDRDGRARAALISRVKGSSGPNNRDIIGYAECAAACTQVDSWNAVGLEEVYVTARLTSKPGVAMQLTASGAPRLAWIATLRNDENGYLRYFSCDGGCTGDNWTGTTLLKSEDLYPGVGLALRGERSAIAFSTHGNVALASCQQNCARAQGTWTPVKVEAGDDLAADRVIPYPNCTLAAWFLYDPSVVFTPDGRATVSYSASDDSGGFNRPDPTQPACKAGTDMIFARLRPAISF